MPNYFGSVVVALGYIAIIMLVCQSGRFKKFVDWMSVTGRMAFTNYILESIICTIIFTGLGFGPFGKIERAYQILIVIAIWVVVIAFSKFWLARFRFGPLEWLWRTLTYWKGQPMLKKRQ
jgi:uncharacterized protein